MFDGSGKFTRNFTSYDSGEFIVLFIRGILLIDLNNMVQVLLKNLLQT